MQNRARKIKNKFKKWSGNREQGTVIKRRVQSAECRVKDDFLAEGSKIHILCKMYSLNYECRRDYQSRIRVIIFPCVSSVRGSA